MERIVVVYSGDDKDSFRERLKKIYADRLIVISSWDEKTVKEQVAMAYVDPKSKKQPHRLPDRVERVSSKSKNLELAILKKISDNPDDQCSIYLAESTPSQSIRMAQVHLATSADVYDENGKLMDYQLAPLIITRDSVMDSLELACTPFPFCRTDLRNEKHLSNVDYNINFPGYPNDRDKIFEELKFRGLIEKSTKSEPEIKKIRDKVHYDTDNGDYAEVNDKGKLARRISRRVRMFDYLKEIADIRRQYKH